MVSGLYKSLCPQVAILSLCNMFSAQRKERNARFAYSIKRLLHVCISVVSLHITQVHLGWWSCHLLTFHKYSETCFDDHDHDDNCIYVEKW